MTVAFVPVVRVSSSGLVGHEPPGIETPRVLRFVYRSMRRAPAPIVAPLPTTVTELIVVTSMTSPVVVE